MVDDGQNRADIIPDGPSTGVYLPPLVWADQCKPSSDAVLLVLASAAYDPADYIRKYDEFLTLVNHP